MSKKKPVNIFKTYNFPNSFEYRIKTTGYDLKYTQQCYIKNQYIQIWIKQDICNNFVVK